MSIEDELMLALEKVAGGRERSRAELRVIAQELERAIRRIVAEYVQQPGRK